MTAGSLCPLVSADLVAYTICVNLLAVSIISILASEDTSIREVIGGECGED